MSGVKRRRYIALGVGAVCIWWGFQAAFLLDSLGALWTGAFVGGFVAALGHASSGFDGAVESILALAVVVTVGTLGLLVWTVGRYGLETVWLLEDAVGLFSVAVVVRQQFMLPVILGGATGGFAAREYLP